MRNKKLNINQDSGFKIPNDYFSNFENRLLDDINLSNKIEQSGFKVPDGYFDKFDDDLNQRLNKEKDSPKVINLFSWQKVVTTVSIAACVLLMFTIFYPENKNLGFDDLETATIENYLEDLDYSNEEIAGLLPEETLKKDNFIDEKIEEEQLEGFLLDGDLEELILN